MSRFWDIYANEAETYHKLVAAEDANGELAAQLARLATDTETIVDIGTGTGRLAVPLCTEGKRVHGVDAAQAMLDVAASKLSSCDGVWALSRSDARDLPIADNWADAAIAGWIYGHFTEFYADTWKNDLNMAIAEMERVVRPGGIEVIIETLGTAVTEPKAPTPLLAEYHQRIETMGFRRTVLRTDYRFATVAESIELLDWFFGLGDWARTHNDPTIPEFTGWWERRAR